MTTENVLDTWHKGPFIGEIVQAALVLTTIERTQLRQSC
jgi:hypothetical protein